MRLPSPASSALLLFALLFPKAQAQQQPATGSVQGHAVLQDTGKPATDAIVSLLPSAETWPPPQIPEEGEFVVRDQPHRGDFYATVDASGSFVIDHVLPGEYTVLTYKPGYVSQDASEPAGTLPNTPTIQKVRVLSGQTASVDLQLERGGSIEGTVSYSDGKPAHAGKQVFAEVAVNLEMLTAEGKFSHFGGAAHTDEQGHYRFDDLPSAKYIVFMALPGGMAATVRGSSATSGMLLFAPSTVRASQAQLVEVSGRETRNGVDIEIPTTGLHTVSGKVVDTAGQPILEGLVRLYPKGEPDLSRANPLNKDGEFSFDNVPDEQYTVTVEFEAKIEFLGITEDKTGIRNRRHKPPFGSAPVEVRVSGQNPPPLLVTADPTH
jgi:Polysaccharide lyase family 4, domain II